MINKQGCLWLQDKSTLSHCIAWFYGCNALIFMGIGARYLFSMLASETLFQTAMTQCATPFAKGILLCFTVLNFITYMGGLACVPALGTLLLARLWPYPTGVMLLSILLNSLFVLALLVDVHIYTLFKFHLSPTLLALAMSPDIYQVFDISKLELIELFAMMLLILGIETGLAIVLLKARVKAWHTVGKWIIIFWGLGALFCYGMMAWSMEKRSNLLLQQITPLPLYHTFLSWVLPKKNVDALLYDLSEQHYTQVLFANKPLHYPKHALQCDAHPKILPNFIFIMVDSLRADALKDMPAVQRFADQSWQFTQYVSGGNSTQAGLFSLFYSIPSSYWTAAIQQQKRPVLMQVLSQYQYHIKAIWSSEMHHPPMDRTIFLGVKDINAEGSVKADLGDADRDTTEQAIAFLKQPASHSPFFLHLFYNAPHGHCRFQSFPSYYQPSTKQCSRLLLNNETDPTPLYNSYRNAVRFVDIEISKIIQTIQAAGYLNNSIIVITSDHGQEYNEHHQNYWGHSGNYTRTQTAVPFILHWPHTQPHRFSQLTTSYDVVPTLLRRMFHCKNAVKDYSIGQDLLDASTPPFILSGSYVTMGMIESDRLTTFHASGAMTVTTLNAEPLAIRPRLDRLREALKLMRYYFVN